MIALLLCKGHLVDLQELAMRLVAGEQVCAVCGCSDNNPCDGDCWWLEGARVKGEDVALCSQCEDYAEPRRRRKRKKQRRTGGGSR